MMAQTRPSTSSTRALHCCRSSCACAFDRSHATPHTHSHGWAALRDRKTAAALNKETAEHSIIAQALNLVIVAGVTDEVRLPAHIICICC